MGFLKEIFNPDISQVESAEAMINNLIERVKKEINVCLPAQVKTYDRTSHIVSVYLGLRNRTKAGTIYQTPVMENIPVVINGGGGYCVNFPLNAGDKGWLLVADKDISNFVANLEISTPNTFRLHNLADAVFIPDVMKTAQINANDAGRAVFQKIDGSIKISVGENDINILGDTNFVGNMDIQGNLTVSGVINAPSIVADTNLQVSGIAMQSHIHGGVISGPNTTEGPKN